MSGAIYKAAALLLRVLCITSALLSPSAFAYQKGDILVGLGVGHLDPRENSDSVKLGNIELGELGVEGQNLPLINLKYFSTDHLAFELLLSKPPNFDIVGTTGLIKGMDIGNIEAYPLIVTAHYFPMDSRSRWQPFVGVGFNYVVPGDTRVNPDLAPIFGADRLEIEVDDSWGLTLSAGLDFIVTEKFSLSVQAYYMDVEGKAEGRLIIGEQEIDVDLFAQTGRAPVLISLSVGYTF